MKEFMVRLIRMLGKLALVLAVLYTLFLFREGHKYKDLWEALWATKLVEAHAEKVLIFLVIGFLIALVADAYENKLKN